MIAIIDYDAGNLKSVEKAFDYLGEKTIITRNNKEILSADKVILPGVGSYGVAIKKLQKYNLINTIKEVTTKGTPMFGICLGLQLLFDTSEETPGVSGLSLLEGDIHKIPTVPDSLKIPHMGWNSLHFPRESRLFHNLPDNSYVYFVHSYYLKAKHEKDVIATSYYGTQIHAAVEKGNIYGCQFHPEKSGDIGLNVLKNFAKL